MASFSTMPLAHPPSRLACQRTDIVQMHNARCEAHCEIILIFADGDCIIQYFWLVHFSHSAFGIIHSAETGP